MRELWKDDFEQPKPDFPDPVADTARRCLAIIETPPINIPLAIGVADGASIALRQIAAAIRAEFGLDVDEDGR